MLFHVLLFSLMEVEFKIMIQVLKSCFGSLLLLAVGNEKSNSFWEAELPPNYDRVGIENFIRAKYGFIDFLFLVFGLQYFYFCVM
jgi:hypothetical protein